MNVCGIWQPLMFIEISTCPSICKRLVLAACNVKNASFSLIGEIFNFSLLANDLEMQLRLARVSSNATTFRLNTFTSIVLLLPILHPFDSRRMGIRP